MAADRAPVAHQVLPGEWQDDEKRDRPAQERQRYRRDMPGGEAADDGVAGPAKCCDREQQIGLVGEPAAGGTEANGAIGSRHKTVEPGSKDAAARPTLPALTAKP